MPKKIFLLSCCAIISLTLLQAFQTDQRNGSAKPDGKSLFRQYCASCHHETSASVAHPFQRVRQARGKAWTYKFVQGPYKFSYSDSVANRILDESPTVVAGHSGRTVAEIDAICDYVDGLPYDPKEYMFRR